MRKFLAPSFDIGATSAVWLLAFVLRYNFELPVEQLYPIVESLPVVVLCVFASLYLNGVYRSVWRFTSMQDGKKILRGATIGALVGFAMLFLFTRMDDIPRAVILIFLLVEPAALIGARFIYRSWREKDLSRDGKRTLIVGAGRAGESLVRELKKSVGEFSIVGFVDDAAKNDGREIHGVRVLGRVDRIPDLVHNLAIELVLIATPSADSKEMRRIYSACQKTKVQVRTLPSVTDLIGARVDLAALRPVKLEDLLGRAPFVPKLAELEANFCDQVIMVTGAGGSIGSELCRILMRFKPAKLVAVDNSEYNLFKLKQELPTIEPHPISVLDSAQIRDLIAKTKPQYIFHAAAFKHVPLMEPHARQAWLNNVWGTYTVGKLARELGVPNFVLVSTDKAVNPTNIMGASKRVAEIVCQGLSGARTQYSIVRFGNVLGSRGSVVETFQEQLAKGEPITVTDSRMTRYFMTIPEAAMLIIHAATLPDDGAIYVLDMGESVRIEALAEQMITLYGKLPHTQVPIVYTGIRPGEKMYEELYYKDEELVNTAVSKIKKTANIIVPSDWEEQILSINEQIDTIDVKEALFKMIALENSHAECSA